MAGRGRQRREDLEPEETLAENLSAPPTASNQQDLMAPKFCLHISIFPVDTPAPFCLEEVGSVHIALRQLVAHQPWQRGGKRGREAQSPLAGECHWGPGGARG